MPLPVRQSVCCPQSRLFCRTCRYSVLGRRAQESLMFGSDTSKIRPIPSCCCRLRARRALSRWLDVGHEGGREVEVVKVRQTWWERPRPPMRRDKGRGSHLWCRTHLTYIVENPYKVSQKDSLSGPFCVLCVLSALMLRLLGILDSLNYFDATHHPVHSDCGPTLGLGVIKGTSSYYADHNQSSLSSFA